MSDRPVVVLAGWLGCQPKYLRRYEQLYHRLGFDVVCHIPTPRMVVEATFRSSPIISQAPPNWPNHQVSLVEGGESSSMQQSAWNILGQVYNKQPSGVLFHAFSNGGCYLWEQILEILLNNKLTKEQTTRDMRVLALSSLRQRINSVVFDSSPCWAGGTHSALRFALHHCSWRERFDILLRYGPGTVLYDGAVETEQRKLRCQAFFQLLKDNSLDVPQLYLYSEDDPLCSFPHLNELVRHRKSVQKSPVVQTVWKSSPHCGHFRAHTQDYTNSIEFFVHDSLKRAKL
jgi:pimeloyl-ACP methyl ester carboxylesterase